MNIADSLKDLRKKNGLTQKELAAKTGLSIATIQGYEQGKYKPKVESLIKIRNALMSSEQAYEQADVFSHIGTTFFGEGKLTTGSPERDAATKEAFNREAKARKTIGNDTKKFEDYIVEEKQKEILNSFRLLNDKGQAKVIEYSKDLCNNPEYRTVSDQDE